jgi:AcrR family transcriptional regulator
MLESTTTLIRQRGVSATSVDDILAHSGAPRGSVYHYFPRGRSQLIEETVDRAGDSVAQLIAVAGEATPVEVFDLFVSAWRDSLVDSDFRSGCPVLAAAIESSDQTPEIVDAAGRAFTNWRSAIAALLRRHRVPRAEARRLTNLIVAGVEGAAVLSRADRNLQPIDDVTRSLRTLLEAAVQRT